MNLASYGSIKSEQKLTIISTYLLNELRVRYSHMIFEVNALPFAETEPLPTVTELCAKTLEELFAHPEIENDPTDKSQKHIASFTELLKKILRRHRDEQNLLAHGLSEWKIKNPELATETNAKIIDRGLDAFLAQRIATRVLSHQHIALYEEPDKEGFIGIIEKKCSPAKIAKEVAHDVHELVQLHHGLSPKMVVLGNTSVTFAYIPQHIYYILIELLKNSALAVMRTHGHGDLPPIKIIVAQGKEDFCIKVSDEGGGISRTKIDQIWNYSFSTEPTPFAQHCGQLHDPIAGYGFGLPLSRLYSRYFRGDLKLMSLDGYGTDAYIFLPRLGNVPEWMPTERHDEDDD